MQAAKRDARATRHSCITAGALACLAFAAAGQTTAPPSALPAPPLPSPPRAGPPLWRMEDSRTHLWGYVDAALHWVIPPTYKQVAPFDGPWAAVATSAKNGTTLRHGIIDTSGRETVTPQWPRPVRFGEGVAVVPTSDKEDAFRYVDHAGRDLFGQTFIVAEPFSDGLAWAMTADYLRGYINRAGKFAILNGRVEETGGPFSEGKAVINRDDGSFRVIDTAGRDLFSARGHAEKFAQGRLRFAIAAGKAQTRWGFCDSTGKVIVPPTYLAAGDFHEGRAAVQESGGIGYIDLSGAPVIPPTFTVADDFNQGVAIAGRDGMLGLLDTDGQWSVAPLFAAADALVQGKALMTERLTPTATRVRLVGAGDSATLNPDHIDVPSGLLAILAADVPALPATFAGIDKLSAVQKTRLLAAIKDVDAGRVEPGLAALTALRKEKVGAASVVLGRMYQLGIGVKTAPTLAAACFVEGALGGDSFALFEYGRLRYGGPEGARDLPDALDAFIRAADARHAPAMRYLAFLQLDGKVLEVNPERALEELHKAAQAGDARAQLAIGYCLETGFACAADRTAALKAYEAAAKAGDVDAMTNAGRLQENAGDPEAARAWYKKAAPFDPTAALRLKVIEQGGTPAGTP